MNRSNKQPFVSFIIPTYNAEKYIDRCLSSIKKQTYPKNKIEILIIDGGSTDRTREIARKYSAIILENRARDAQIGKAIGINTAEGEFIALLEADIEIAQNDWLEKMLSVLIKEPDIMGMESNFLIKKGDYLVNRYCALLRLEDPVARYIGFLPYNAIREKKESYTIYTVKKGRYPVMGAGGFIWRKSILKLTEGYKNSFDEADFVAQLLDKGFNKVGNIEGCGVYHHHVETIADFIKKRLRTGREFLARRTRKEGIWLDRYSKWELLKAVFFCLNIVYPLYESIRGYLKDRDIAWFLHPMLAFLTVVSYGMMFFRYFPRLVREKRRI